MAQSRVSFYPRSLPSGGPRFGGSFCTADVRLVAEKKNTKRRSIGFSVDADDAVISGDSSWVSYMFSDRDRSC